MMAKLYMYTLFLLLLLLICSIQASITQVSVCHEGHLTVTCRTVPAETLLRWSITIPGRSRPEIRLIPSSGRANSVQSLTVGQTVFQFLRISTSPLTSTMAIDDMTIGLNGTMIECSYGGGIASTHIIHVIGTLTTIPNPVEVVNKHFEADSVTAFMEWVGEEGVVHSINVMPVPHVAMSRYGSRSQSIQLTLPYNIVYNVSIVFSLCGQMSVSHFQLHYVKCPSLLHLLSDDSVKVAGYSEPPLEESVISIDCSFGSDNEPNSTITTCMDNGEWEPIPDIQCKDICGVPLVPNSINLEYNSTLEGSTLQFSCKSGFLPNDVFTAVCYNNKSWVPDPTSYMCTLITSPENSSAILVLDLKMTIIIGTSLVVVLLSCSVFIFCIGCICGHKHMKQVKSEDINQVQTTQEPLYDDLQLKPSPDHQGIRFELEENTAYFPV